MTTDIHEITNLIATVTDVCKVIQKSKGEPLPLLIIDIVKEVVPDLIECAEGLRELPGEVVGMDKESVDLVLKQLCDLAVLIIETVVAEVI